MHLLAFWINYAIHYREAQRFVETTQSKQKAGKHEITHSTLLTLYLRCKGQSWQLQENYDHEKNEAISHLRVCLIQGRSGKKDTARGLTKNVFDRRKKWKERKGYRIS